MTNQWLVQPTTPRRCSTTNSNRIQHASFGKIQDIFKPCFAKGEDEHMAVHLGCVGSTAMQNAIIKEHRILLYQCWPHGGSQRLATFGGQYHGSQVARQKVASRSEFGRSHSQWYIVQWNKNIHTVTNITMRTRHFSPHPQSPRFTFLPVPSALLPLRPALSAGSHLGLPLRLQQPMALQTVS